MCFDAFTVPCRNFGLSVRLCFLSIMYGPAQSALAKSSSLRPWPRMRQLGNQRHPTIGWCAATSCRVLLAPCPSRAGSEVMRRPSGRSYVIGCAARRLPVLVATSKQPLLGRSAARWRACRVPSLERKRSLTVCVLVSICFIVKRGPFPKVSCAFPRRTPWRLACWWTRSRGECRSPLWCLDAFSRGWRCPIWWALASSKLCGFWEFCEVVPYLECLYAGCSTSSAILSICIEPVCKIGSSWRVSPRADCIRTWQRLSPRRSAPSPSAASSGSSSTKGVWAPASSSARSWTMVNSKTRVCRGIVGRLKPNACCSMPSSSSSSTVKSRSTSGRHRMDQRQAGVALEPAPREEFQVAHQKKGRPPWRARPPRPKAERPPMSVPSPRQPLQPWQHGQENLCRVGRHVRSQRCRRSLEASWSQVCQRS